MNLKKPSLSHWVIPVVISSVFLISACGSDDDKDKNSTERSENTTDNNVIGGVIKGIPIEGLMYQVEGEDQTTNAMGEFSYEPDTIITFKVGEYVVGSAVGKPEITLMDFVDGAEQLDHQAVTNIAVLLHALDDDENANNGIRIKAETADIVSNHASQLNVDQTPEEFANSSAVGDLLAELNVMGDTVFKDTDPRDRTLQDSNDVIETQQRGLSDRLVVETSQGDLRGFTTADGKAWSWYGVPYAKPPLGDLRWQPPVQPESWEGVRDAIAWGDQSAQPLTYEGFGEGGMSEDSLYLNITVPKDYDGQSLPVMVWFHGGGFRILTGNTKAFNNTTLPSQGVIVVTVTHRLGVFGYLAHPALTSESENNSSGNYGQLDLIAALKWVRDNIAEFGGDSENVTIFGESGGGGKSLSLLHSPLASGLFHRAIIQSGTREPGDPTANSLVNRESMGEALVARLNLVETDDVLTAMREVDWRDLAQVAEDALDAGEYSPEPTIDGYYNPTDIKTAVETGKHNDVPIILGANSDDSPGLDTGLVSYLSWLPDNNKSPVYAYIFDHVPDGWHLEGVGAYHGIELVYSFDYPGSFASHYLLGLTGHVEPSLDKFATTDNPALNPDEYSSVMNLMTGMWSSFAADSDPTITDVPWETYDSDKDNYLKISTAPSMEAGVIDAFE